MTSKTPLYCSFLVNAVFQTDSKEIDPIRFDFDSSSRLKHKKKTSFRCWILQRVTVLTLFEPAAHRLSDSEFCIKSCLDYIWLGRRCCARSHILIRGGKHFCVNTGHLERKCQRGRVLGSLSLWKQLCFFLEWGGEGRGGGWLLSSAPLLCLASGCVVWAACVSRDLGAAAQCLELLFVGVAAMGRTDGQDRQTSTAL